MYKISLSLEEKTLLKTKIKEHTNPWLIKRFQSILMRNDKIKTEQIAEYVSMDVNTITNWVKLYLSGGIAVLEKLNLEDRRQSQLAPIKSEIESYVNKEDNVVDSMKQLSNWIEENYQIKIEKSWLRKWCKKNSISLIKRHV